MEAIKFEPREVVVRVLLSETEHRIITESLQESINRARSHIRRSQVTATPKHAGRSATKITRQQAVITQSEMLLDRLERQFEIGQGGGR